MKYLLAILLFSSCTVTVPYKHIENNKTAKYYADSIRNSKTIK